MRSDNEVSGDCVHPMRRWMTAERLVHKLRTGAKAPLRSRERQASFVRWRQVTIAQFGFVTNTVLVLATASIGFALGQAPMFPDSPRRAMLVGVFVLGLSGLFALACSWNRLLDFRLTAQIPRASERSELDTDREVARCISSDLGEQSWCFLKCQLVTFGLGVFIVGAALVCSLWTGDVEPRNLP